MAKIFLVDLLLATAGGSIIRKSTIETKFCRTFFGHICEAKVMQLGVGSHLDKEINQALSGHLDGKSQAGGRFGKKFLMTFFPIFKRTKKKAFQMHQNGVPYSAFHFLRQLFFCSLLVTVIKPGAFSLLFVF